MGATSAAATSVINVYSGGVPSTSTVQGLKNYSTSMGVLGVVFALILMSPLLMGAENVKHHINFGTTFSPRGSICFSTEAWRHSFLIDIGKPFHIPAFPFCAVTTRTSNSSICAAKNRLAFAVNAIRTELGHHLNDMVKLLEQLLPNTVLPKDV